MLEQDNNIQEAVEEQGFNPFSLNSVDETVDEEYYEVEETNDAEVDEVSLDGAREQHAKMEDSQPKKKLSPEEAYRKVQSEKDRLASELDKLRNQYGEFEAYAPIVRYMQEHPEVIDSLENQLSGNVNKQPEVVATEPEIVKPARPEKPKGYSRYEAYNDADSESAKYEESLLEYQEQLADYNLKLNESYQQRIERERSEREMIDKQRQFVSSTVNTLVTQHGFQQQEAVEFIREMSKPQPTMDELVQLWKIKRAPKQTDNQLTKEQLQEKANMLKAKQQPLPVGAGKGYADTPADSASSFSQSLGRSRVPLDIFAVKK